MTNSRSWSGEKGLVEVEDGAMWRYEDAETVLGEAEVEGSGGGAMA